MKSPFLLFKTPVCMFCNLVTYSLLLIKFFSPWTYSCKYTFVIFVTVKLTPECSYIMLAWCLQPSITWQWIFFTGFMSSLSLHLETCLFTNCSSYNAHIIDLPFSSFVSYFFLHYCIDIFAVDTCVISVLKLWLDW